MYTTTRHLVQNPQSNLKVKKMYFVTYHINSFEHFTFKCTKMQILPLFLLARLSLLCGVISFVWMLWYFETVKHAGNLHFPIYMGIFLFKKWQLGSFRSHTTQKLHKKYLFAFYWAYVYTCSLGRSNDWGIVNLHNI